MQYFGGKARISKPLAEFLNGELEEGQPFVDAFCGSCNVISKIDPNRVRIANDKHEYLIAMWKALQDGWIPPEHVSKEDYYHIKNNPDENKALTGFVGFGMSFGGKYFGGFTGEVSKNGQDYLKCAKNGVFKKIVGLDKVHFHNNDFKSITVPENSMIYCDIPYKGTTQYNKATVGHFPHEDFYAWGRLMSKKGHKVYVSEYVYNVPDDCEILWSIQSGTTNAAWQGSAKKTEEVVFRFL